MNGLSYEYLLKEVNAMGIKPTLNDSTTAFHSITKRAEDEGNFDIVRNNIIRCATYLLTLSFPETQQQTLRASIETLQDAVNTIELSREVNIIFDIILSHKNPSL